MKNLRIYVIIFLLSFASGTVFSQQLSGDSWSKIKANGSGEVTITYNFSGEFMKKGPSGLEGLCYQIYSEFIKYVEAKHGVNIKTNIHYPKDPVDFTAFLNSVKNGKGGVFGLADVTITEERKNIVQFSPSFFSNVSILLTNNSVPELNNFNNIDEAFAGMTLIVQRGTTHEKRANEIKKNLYPKLKIEVVNSFEACYQKVNESDQYFTYLDFSSYLTAMKQVRNIKRHQAGDKTGESFGLIMPKNSDWSPLMKEFFEKEGGFTNSNTYKKMVANTLGTHVVAMLNSINQ